VPQEPTALVLASASPRRRELLAHLGLPFEVTAADVDETVRPGEPPAAYVERLARTKAGAWPSAGTFVLAADTSVVVDDDILGKPGDDRALGAAMLRRLRGRTHRVLTGVAVAHGPKTWAQVVTTEVDFVALTEAQIAWYVASGEGRDKAGGYAVQGRAGLFIAAVRGSASNVIGLPLAETTALLREAGLRLPWDAPR
jgi:septum formation protein